MLCPFLVILLNQLPPPTTSLKWWGFATVLILHLYLIIFMYITYTSTFKKYILYCLQFPINEDMYKEKRVIHTSKKTLYYWAMIQISKGITFLVL